MYSAQSPDYLQFQYQSQCEENNSDRNTPDSSDGIGSSVSSSPIPSESNSRSISPENEQNKQVYSTPSFNFQNYYNNMPFTNSTNANFNSNYPNYQDNYYYNYNFSQQNNHHKLLNNSSQFDDSNYYSRNNSILQSEQLNDSYNNYQKYQNNFALPTVPIKQEEIKQKAVLKFSIESILGLNKNETNLSPKKVENKIKPQLDLSVSNDESINEEPKTKNGKRKRSSRKSVDSNKRIRTIFTQEQLDKLEVEFNRQQYMVGSERSYLANVLNLTESQVKIWFQNRRIKWRKANMGTNGNEKSSNDEFLNESYSNESFADE